MSKDLEALKIGIPKLKKLYENSAKKMSSNDILGFDLVFVYLDKALQRLESIDNAKPSEALECLEDAGELSLEQFGVHIEDYKYLRTLTDEQYDTIKQALIKSQVAEKENAKYKQLEKELGCSIVMILNLIINSNTLDERCHTQDVYFDYKGKLISGSFVKLEYHDEFIINVETDEMFDSHYDIDDYDLKVKDYKKTWWLKKDRSM